MPVQTILISVVSGIFLLSGSGDIRAESSSSSIPTLEIVSIDPPSPAILEAGEKVTVKVRYDMADCESVVIWVRSIRSSGGELAHDSSTINRTNGQIGTMEGYFYFNKKAEAKDIRVTMTDVSKHTDVCRVTQTVDYQWMSPQAPKSPTKLEGTTRIPGSYTWDIDSDTIGGNSKLVDLWFQVDRSNEQVLVTRNNAGMAIFDLPFDQLQLEQLQRCSFGQKSRSSLQERYPLKPGFCFGLKTSEGRIAKLELLADDFPKCLVFHWLLYPDSAKQESGSRKPTKTDPSKQYEGLWVYTDPWARSGDRIVALVGWFDQRGRLIFDLVKHSSVSKPLFAETTIRKDQIEIRFDGIEYAGRNSTVKTMTYSLLYHEDQLLGQAFRDGLEPEKVVMRRADLAMANQIIAVMARDNRELQSRLDREQTQAAGEKLTLKNSLKSLEATNGQLQAVKSGLSVLLDRARKEIEDMKVSWDRAREQIAELQKELAEIRQANRELTDQKQKVQKTIQALEDMLRQAHVTKPD